ncbi:protein kinase [Corallococcus coralloides]|nr:protein kinase [Corallococcus coralloides]
MALQAGDVFGRYELVSWLGRGGMAETWRAQLVGDAGVTKPVLIKKVLPEYANDEAFISMFISEARISATLSHANVAQVFDFGRVDGEYFLAMEFVDGQPLHRVLKRALKGGAHGLPLPVAVFIAMEMCRGLHYAHTRTSSSGEPLGIVHRDISPDNVLLGYEGQVKIVDFGIAKAQLIRGFKTAPGVVKGKYLFFSPEQARGEEVDARTDVWATGVVLYELLCGKLPVEGPPHVVMMRLGRGEIPAPTLLRPDLPGELNDIVMKALTPDREQRFDSSHAFGDALAGFLYSNFPRFSAMSVAYLLRMLFQGELAQEGRALAVPDSFLDVMDAWREPSASAQQAVPPQVKQSSPHPVLQTARLPEPTQTATPDLPASSRRPRRWLAGVGVGSLLAAGACLWMFLEPRPSQPRTAEPLPEVLANAASPQSTPAEKPAEKPAEESKPFDYSQVPRFAFRGLIWGALLSNPPTGALEAAEHCLEVYPRAPECHLFLGGVHARLGNTETSERHYSTFLKVAPDGYPGRSQVVQLLEKGGTDSEHMEAILSVNIVPGGPAVIAYHRHALTLIARKEYNAAVAAAQGCLDINPAFADCEISLAYSYAKLGDHESSSKHYERFLAVAPFGHPKRKRIIKVVEGNTASLRASRENLTK